MTAETNAAAYPEPLTHLPVVPVGVCARIESERDSAIKDRQALYAQLQRVRADLNDALATIDDLRNDIIAIRASRLKNQP